MPVLPNVPSIPATFIETTLRIEGMHCAHCLHTVEKTLKALPGVIVESVELGRAEVAYDPRQTTLTVLAKALETHGYTLRTDPVVEP